MKIQEFIAGTLGDWYSIRKYLYATGKTCNVHTKFSITPGKSNNKVLIAWHSVGDLSSSEGEMQVEFCDNGQIKRDRGYLTKQPTDGRWQLFGNKLVTQTAYGGNIYEETISLFDKFRIRQTIGLNEQDGSFALSGQYFEFRDKPKDWLVFNSSAIKPSLPPMPDLELTVQQQFLLESLKRELADCSEQKAKEMLLMLMHQHLQIKNVNNQLIKHSFGNG